MLPERVVKRVITRVITGVDAEDGDAAEALLRASGLPLAGLEDTALWGLERRGQLVAVGGFERYGDLALLRREAIELLVCKNAGGSGARAKLIAARTLGLPVVMIDRPPLADRAEVHDVAAVLHWIGHAADRGV